MENNKTQTKKKKIITVIAFMIIFFSTYFGVQQFFSKPTFDKELVKVANEINKICLGVVAKSEVAPSGRLPPGSIRKL